MSGMDHSGHDMSSMTTSGGGFAASDEYYARVFWYAVAACVAFLTITKAIDIVSIRRRLKAQRRDSKCIPSRPTGWLSQAYATATATMREMMYPQPVYFTGRISKYFSPLPVGRWLLLILYWIVILSFIWTDTIIPEGDSMYAYRWEKVGFRAAWVSVTQVPFIYLLSCKFNPISLLTGISYERFNWLHRWAARTLWLTAIVHWSFFYTEWSLAGIVKMQLRMMSMVKYGFGAWGVMTWMLLSGFGFFRDLSYELFVIQHIAAAGTLLWLLFVHVPSSAQYNIWIAVAFVSFDWGMRVIWGLLRNTHLLGRSVSKSPGYATNLEALPGNVVRLTVEDADFSWQAGQHIYVYMPGLRPFEFHPFTIAGSASGSDGKAQKQLTLLIQAKSGFSRSLHNAATKPTARQWRQRTFISGPWGTPPDLSHYETVVLIACSTGATFIVPLLQNVVRREGCVRNITLHWIIRSEEHFSWFANELRAVAADADKLEMNLRLEVHITRGSTAVVTDAKEAGVTIFSTGTSSSSSSGENSLSSVPSAEDENSALRPVARSPPTLKVSHSGRPALEKMIRPAVERALGETAVIVCGGLSITAESRTYVAKLSDERAVHKGTGAQGIYLFTETYGW